MPYQLQIISPNLIPNYIKHFCNNVFQREANLTDLLTQKGRQIDTGYMWIRMQISLGVRLGGAMATESATYQLHHIRYELQNARKTTNQKNGEK